MNKDKLIATISDMPQDFELETLMEKLIFIEKVEKGLEQLNSGNTISHEEVRKRIKQWQK